MKCPCNPTKEYSECCQKAHKNIKEVATAEQLMRSRYSAFVLADIDYLQKSNHSSTRLSKNDYLELKKWTKSVAWLKLEIIETSKGTVIDSTGTVEFKAFYLENGVFKNIHENSKFCKENKHWVYVDGKN